MTLEEFVAACAAAEAEHERTIKLLTDEYNSSCYVAHRKLDRATGAAAKEFSKTPEGKAYLEEHFPKTY